MAGSDERYNERVEFQRRLDDLFPRGAYCVSAEMRPDGSLVPGVAMTVGRVFCSNAGEDDEGWWFELLLDPVSPQTAEEEYAWPFTARVRELDEVEDVPGLYEALVEHEPLLEVEVDSQVSEVVRLHSDPAGPRAPARGQRDVVTERREDELFPRGLELIELESAE